MESATEQARVDVSVGVDSVPGMAFTTRKKGRTVAIGHGSLVTARTLWGLSSVLLLVPLAVVVLAVVQAARPELESALDRPLASLVSASLAALALIFMMRVFAGTCGIGTFAGPSGRVRDQIGSALGSQTAWAAVLSIIAVLALVVVTRLPSSDSRDIAFIALVLSLILLDVLVHRGLRRLGASNRKVPYFAGMTEQQKRVADRPWPTWERPSFPSPKTLMSRADAQRYARRANDIALLHEWIGTGLVVVFSAFVGTTILGMVESKDPSGQLPMLLVLGFVALGIWLQRRARSYRRLADSFSDRHRHRPARTLSARGRGIRRGPAS